MLFFVLLNIIFQLSDMVLIRYINIQFYKYKLHYRNRDVYKIQYTKNA